MDSQSDDDSSVSAAAPSRPPIIDRGAKARMLLANKAKVVEVGEVLQAEKDLVEQDVELGKAELKLAESWEVTRLKREKEAEQEMMKSRKRYMWSLFLL